MRHVGESGNRQAPDRVRGPDVFFLQCGLPREVHRRSRELPAPRSRGHDRAGRHLHLPHASGDPAAGSGRLPQMRHGARARDADPHDRIYLPDASRGGAEPSRRLPQVRHGTGAAYRHGPKGAQPGAPGRQPAFGGHRAPDGHPSSRHHGRHAARAPFPPMVGQHLRVGTARAGLSGRCLRRFGFFCARAGGALGGDPGLRAPQRGVARRGAGPSRRAGDATSRSSITCPSILDVRGCSTASVRA